MEIALRRWRSRAMRLGRSSEEGAGGGDCGGAGRGEGRRGRAGKGEGGSRLSSLCSTR